MLKTIHPFFALAELYTALTLSVAFSLTFRKYGRDGVQEAPVVDPRTDD